MTHCWCKEVEISCSMQPHERLWVGHLYVKFMLHSDSSYCCCVTNPYAVEVYCAYMEWRIGLLHIANDQSLFLNVTNLGWRLEDVTRSVSEVSISMTIMNIICWCVILFNNSLKQWLVIYDMSVACLWDICWAIDQQCHLLCALTPIDHNCYLSVFQRWKLINGTWQMRKSSGSISV